MAYNSTIQKKKCKCGCGRFPTLSCGGFNYNCLSAEEKERLGDRRKVTISNQNKRKSEQVKIRALARENDEDKRLLEAWFLLRMNTCDPVCENCGARKDDLKEDSRYKYLWRSCQAHLLSKKLFKSIASNPLNGMVLGSGYSGLCTCHDMFDASWLSASKMKIFPQVIERVKQLLPFIAEEEKRFLPNVILDKL